MKRGSISIALFLLLSFPAARGAQLDCKAIRAGSERTDCYIALGQFYRAQSDLAAAKARAQSDAAWHRAIAGTSPPKQRLRR